MSDLGICAHDVYSNTCLSETFCWKKSFTLDQPGGAVKMSMQHGIQLYHIPSSKSAVTEHVKHKLESHADMAIDAECHKALKDGGLGTLSGDVGAGFMAIPGSSGSSSGIPLPIGNVQDEEEIAEKDHKDISIKVKRGENCLKVGLHVLQCLDQKEDIVRRQLTPHGAYMFEKIVSQMLSGLGCCFQVGSKSQGSCVSGLNWGTLPPRSSAVTTSRRCATIFMCWIP